MLTVKGIEGLAPGYHADGGKLYLQITATGSKSWIFRYQRYGRRRDMGLGPYPFVGLADARRLANECRECLFRGVDPLDRKHAVRASEQAAAAKQITFQECAEQYIEGQRAGWQPRHARQWETSLTKWAYPTLGKLPVDAIETAHIVKVIEPLWGAEANPRRPGAQSDRGRTELGDGARVPPGRQSGTLARTPR